VSDDLEIIPLGRRAEDAGPPGPPAGPAGPPPGSKPRRRRPPAGPTILWLVAGALVAGSLVAARSGSPSRPAPNTPPPGTRAGTEIACPTGPGFAGTDLGQLVPPRESPEAAVAGVVEAFRGHPVAGYHYEREQEGGDWVAFLGTAGAVPKARVSVRHLGDRWAPVAIAACAGDYPAGLVDYPADRRVPPLTSTAGLLLAVNDPLQRSGPLATLVLQDSAGRTVWELPAVGAWYPTPLSWSPDGRRFLFQVSAGDQTETRALVLPEGRDVTVPGALTWIGDDALLVWRDGRLNRLDLDSGALVSGPPLAQFVSSQAGTRGAAALVILPGVPPGTHEPKAVAPFVRIVDMALHQRDTSAPAGTIDCFSPAWTADGQHIDLVCRRSDPPPGSPDTEVYDIDVRTLRWTQLPAGAVGSVEAPLRSPARG
jgi:hypothetical protein